MIRQGDVRDVLPTLDAGSVQCVITSPPYWGLRDYGMEGQIGLEPTPDEYVQAIVEVFREVKRVLRDDGTLWLNLGDSYAGSGKGQMGDGTSANINNKQSTNKGSSTGGLPTDYGHMKPKDLVGIPWRVAFALQADGWYLRSDIVWAKGVSFCPDYSGSVMPESVTDRPTKSHEYLFLLTKSARYYYDADAVRENNSGTVRNLRSVWTINPKPYTEAHFATFPTTLVEPCVKAGTKKGDTVLDPFTGSGTTGLVAGKMGREFIGIDLNADYIRLANDRIEGPLFSNITEKGER
jgi:site-specific DNA-methyltransferase (cytosine-N4-specific)